MTRLAKGGRAAQPGLEPIGIWDCNDKRNAYWWHWREASEWAMAHISDANSTYRAEFYLVDAPYAVLWRHKRDEDGKLRLHDGELLHEVVTQMLDELPPRHTLAVP